jgi:CRISPR-associated protein Cst1
MKIALSGNPFVDTGLGVIAALGGLDDVTALTLAKMREVFDDGTKLAVWNSKLKTFTQVFGTNGPLFQTGYGYKKGDGPSSRNFEIYKKTLKAFLDSIREEPRGAPCEACGNLTAFDFANACSPVIEAAGAKVSGEKWIGREWFPLSGSLGSDAQALPAASRPVCLCPKCLLAVHYLPMALISVDGRLAVFQSTSIDFWYELVKDIITGDGGTQVRIPAGQYETPGTKKEVVLRPCAFCRGLGNSMRQRAKGTSLVVRLFGFGVLQTVSRWTVKSRRFQTPRCVSYGLRCKKAYERKSRSCSASRVRAQQASFTAFPKAATILFCFPTVRDQVQAQSFLRSTRQKSLVNQLVFSL